MTKRRLDYDVLRIFSMFGVIYLHTAAGALRTLSAPALWNFSNFFACLATPAVPLFFMMSGALLLSEDKTADLSYLFRRRLPRVVVPALAWTALVLFYKVLTGNGREALVSLSRLLNNGVAVPYWFLYALLPMYLLSPMLKLMTDRLTDGHWNYMMALWVFLTLGLFTIREFAPSTEWELVFTEHWTLNINMVGGYLGYFFLGAWLERWEKPPSRRALAAVTAALLAFSVLATRWDTYRRMYYSDRFTNYLTVFTMLLASAMFLLAKSCLRGRETGGKLIPCLSALSFGVYLIHPLAIGVWERLWSYFLHTPGPAGIPGQLFFYITVSLFCVAACLFLSSVKPLCFLFTGQTWAAACRSSNLFALLGKKSQKSVDNPAP